MYQRKYEDNRRHKKGKLAGWKYPWWHDEIRGCYIYTKNGRHNRRYRYYKRLSNRIIRHSDNEFNQKGSQYKRGYDYWWELW